MAVRPGHHRPIGTTTVMRFTDWGAGRLPELGDVAFQISGPDEDDIEHVRRAYLVVGVREGKTRESFKLVMERLDFRWALDQGPYDATVPWWLFYNLPRSRP